MPDATYIPTPLLDWWDSGHADLPWNAMSFVLGGQRYTVAYLDHPNNPKEARYSERNYGRFGSYFEREVTAQAPRAQAAGSRINEERFAWFMGQVRSRYTKLSEFVAGDRPFSAATLDAYSQAWALTYYLAEKRSADFADYLQTIRGREPLAPYSAKQRLADFRTCFGDDVAWVEVEWLRFMDGLR